MKFKDITQNEDGSLSFDVQTSPDEVAFLVDYAVGELLREGIISINGLSDQDVTLRETAH